VLYFVAALPASSANDFKVKALGISHPWSRPTANGVIVVGEYLTITNMNRVLRTRRLVDGTEIKPGSRHRILPL